MCTSFGVPNPHIAQGWTVFMLVISPLEDLLPFPFPKEI